MQAKSLAFFAVFYISGETPDNVLNSVITVLRDQ